MNCVAYRLPTSFVVVTGTVERTIDQLTQPYGESAPDLRLKEYSVSVACEGDGPTYLVAPARGNWLWSYKGSFATTVDGRLTSASTESSGTLSTVVSSMVGVAGAVLGVGAMLATEGPAASPEDTHLEAALGADQRELRWYARDHPAEYELAKGLAARAVQLRADLIDAIRKEFAEGAGPNESDRISALKDLTDEALVRSRTQYAAWREGTRTSVEDRFEIRQRMHDVPIRLPDPGAESAYSDPVSINPAGDSCAELPTDLADLWLRFGVGITATWPGDDRRARAPQGKLAPGNGSESEHVLIRTPDPVELSVTTRAPIPNSGRYQRSVISRSRHWVADANSVHHWFKLEKSVWGRRSLTLAFDTDGFLSGVSTDADASLPTSLTTLTESPDAVTRALESVTRAQSALLSAKGGTPQSMP